MKTFVNCLALSLIFFTGLAIADTVVYEPVSPVYYTSPTYTYRPGSDVYYFRVNDTDRKCYTTAQTGVTTIGPLTVSTGDTRYQVYCY